MKSSTWLACFAASPPASAMTSSTPADVAAFFAPSASVTKKSFWKLEIASPIFVPPPPAVLGLPLRPPNSARERRRLSRRRD